MYGPEFQAVKKRLKYLKTHGIEYNNVTYRDMSEMCVAIGISKEVFMWLYLTRTDWSIARCIELALEIENA
jgi:hypothetical protein